MVRCMVACNDGNKSVFLGFAGSDIYLANVAPLLGAGHLLDIAGVCSPIFAE
jgi:hypothetical protein